MAGVGGRAGWAERKGCGFSIVEKAFVGPRGTSISER